MLGAGKLLFNGVMDLHGNGVGVPQGQVTVAGDLHIHIIPGAKLAGLQIVQRQYAGLGCHQVPHLLQGLAVDGTVQHLAQGIQQDLQGRFQDQHADDEGGHGVQHREAQLGAGHAHQHAAGGEHIGTVVQGVGHQGVGLDAFGGPAGEAEHPFFCQNGDGGSHQGDGGRGLQVAAG